MNKNLIKKYYKTVKEIIRPLSNFDIEKALNGKINIILYSDIKNVKNLDEFFNPYNAVIILYETGEDIGHWILIMKQIDVNGNTYIEFFDPYGTNLDDTLDYSVKEKFPYLTKLIYENGIDDIRWNNMKLQKLENNVNTCGRWCIFRVRNRDMCLDCFQDMIINSDFYPKLTDWYVYLQTKDV